MNIPYGRQSISEEDISAVLDVLRSDYLTTGSMVSKFEKAVADYVGAKYALAVSNGTAALHLACMAAGITKGDEVITTPITFAASANSVFYCEAVPVFADINPLTYNIDSKDILRKITSKTKAVIPVHYTGLPCEMGEIYQIAKEQSLIVIEDGAHALGAEYKGRKIGSLSDLTTFSFHPVKHITTGEGGMVTTNDENLYNRLLLLREHGITRKEEWMSQKEGDWYYQQIDLGYNYRITDIQCALGISQLKKIEFFLKRRREIAQMYNNAFGHIDGIVIPKQENGCSSSWHLYVIQIINKDRKHVFDKLRKAGIGVNVHYIPVYKHPYYQDHGYDKVYCSHAEELYKHIISLPMYPDLTKEEQEYVIGEVLKLT